MLRKVEDMGMKFVRSMLAVTERNKVRNEVILGIAGVQGVVEAKARWYGHVIRMDVMVEMKYVEKNTAREVEKEMVRTDSKKCAKRESENNGTRKYDYFDAGMMEGLQHRLIKMTQQRTLGDLATAPGHTMRLCSKVMARRVEMDGSTRLLLRWFPEHILEDEWVLESNIERIRDVPLTNLPASASDHVRTALYDVDGSLAKSLFAKQKRKSTKKT
uniref:AEBP2-like C-terminal SH3 domain-containing protein n=1 Tax=Timema tahoe TaxID=61484 RepID=A0A7R9NWK4_9NEOP|nr:unnamed protein product [Timema tahoe]